LSSSCPPLSPPLKRSLRFIRLLFLHEELGQRETCASPLFFFFFHAGSGKRVLDTARSPNGSGPFSLLRWRSTWTMRLVPVFFRQASSFCLLLLRFFFSPSPAQTRCPTRTSPFSPSTSAHAALFPGAVLSAHGSCLGPCSLSLFHLPLPFFGVTVPPSGSMGL